MPSFVRLCCIALSLLPGMTQSQGGPSQAELDAAQEATDWLMVNHDYAGQRFVDLKQITRENAARLRPACRFDVGDTQRFSANPLVYHGVMYITAAFSTIAIDAATCQVKWRHEWKPKAKEAQINFRGMLVNPYKTRGPAIKDGKLVRSTSDSHLIALALDSGELLWERMIGVDENTALVGRLGGEWKVMGESKVHIFTRDGSNTYSNGQILHLN